MSHKLLFLTLILLLSQITNAQIAVEKKPTDDPEKLKKEAVAFLRETMTDINNLRTLENRISFAAELAGLMWFRDEKEARVMFAAAINDFNELLTQYDGEMNSLGMPAEDEGASAGFMMIMGEPTDRNRLMRKFQTAMAVRQQIAGSLAEHDGEMAFAFYRDSSQSVSNAEFRSQMENRDDYFEHQLMSRIADKNPGKAVQFGAKSLDKGITYNHIELLKKIYAKDADKGADFGASILSRVKSEKPDSSDFYVLSALLSFGGETLDKSKKEGGKKPVYSQTDLRDIADVLAQAILNKGDENGSSGAEYAQVIEKYSPARAAQIRAKFRSTNSNSNRAAAANITFTMHDVPSSNTNMRYGANVAPADAIANSTRTSAHQEREKAEQKMLEDIQGLAAKQLPKEEREKIVAQARKIIVQTPGKDKKIAALSLLAAQVAKIGDVELAADIMKDAQNLVNPQPKNYQDFLLTWMLASGYAEANPAKAFPLLEDTILRANETISAFIKVGEFIDVAGEMIQEGEVQVGAFGGSMIRGLTSELGMADATLQTLAKADFTKTKNLTNRFDRTEVRILAKMMILRAVLGEKEKTTGDKEVMPMTETESINSSAPPQQPRRRPN